MIDVIPDVESGYNTWELTINHETQSSEWGNLFSLFEISESGGAIPRVVT